METSWISVKEKKPKTFGFLANCSDQILVHFWLDSCVPDVYGETRRYETDSLGFYTADGRWMALVGVGDDIDRYTYREVDAEFWMPIPSVPRKKNC